MAADTVTYTALITACANAKQLGEAMRVFCAMETAGVAANTVTYSALITACANTGNPGAALDLLECMHRGGLRGDAYTFSAVFTAVWRDRSGRFDVRALALFDGDVPLDVRNGYVYLPVMSICGRVARGRVLPLLEEARRIHHCRRPHRLQHDPACLSVEER